MIKVLANDGIAPEGKKILEDGGFSVDTRKFSQAELQAHLDNYQVLLVRSATRVTADIIDSAPALKLIGRAGVGLDNIDVEHARKKGVTVINTPAASSLSVAELVFAHMFGMARMLHRANREMPARGNSAFGELKKAYAKGSELRGKTLGIIGMGRIGQEVAKVGLGLGMEIIVHDPRIDQVFLSLDFLPLVPVPEVSIKTSPFEDVVAMADFITFHVPGPVEGKCMLGNEEIQKMKKGAFVVNTARGGVVDEDALLSALDNGLLSGVALDVFENEPEVSEKVLQHPLVSLSPHTGASTSEAQIRIGTEIARKIVEFFKA